MRELPDEVEIRDFGLRVWAAMKMMFVSVRSRVKHSGYLRYLGSTYLSRYLL